MPIIKLKRCKVNQFLVVFRSPIWVPVYAVSSEPRFAALSAAKIHAFGLLIIKQ
ncbi:hypothetical protein GPLA_2267 [Paraglaciecola polaris LMG 21857]|uniref:Uncharacterized protein n=1 Tax=Paraglaciecola polaris LMG 21857 TaxID=1129793 RepID=K6ZS91_9ALTE|nr:hypothetical protein GPLA_2267 [Paraglaciecola polaris LMG 21857]